MGSERKWVFTPSPMLWVRGSSLVLIYSVVFVVVVGVVARVYECASGSDVKREELKGVVGAGMTLRATMNVVWEVSMIPPVP